MPFGCGYFNRENFYKFYGRFEEIGLSHVGHVFVWHQHFGFDIRLRIAVKIYRIYIVLSNLAMEIL
jgi:hypothetical protein